MSFVVSSIVEVLRPEIFVGIELRTTELSNPLLYPLPSTDTLGLSDCFFTLRIGMSPLSFPMSD